jgi:glyoxylase-like metal-dependent hydrolase (beta-lactamase superfamily II)
MQVKAFFDPATFTVTYVVWNAATRDAVIIDPVLDYDPLASQTSTASADSVAAFLRAESLRLHYVLETHAHADHLSASQYFKRRFDAKVAIGTGIRDVQAVFHPVFMLGADVPKDGSQFDRLLADGDEIKAGELTVQVIATPGHTPACVSFKIDDGVFTGDALFIEDYGTGRCDFPAGSAENLYSSIHDKLYVLPDTTRVFVGHDYQPDGRELRYETTIGASKEANIQLRASTPKEEFVAYRKRRDAGLSAPKLLYPSIQVNIDAGRLPKPRDNGKRYLMMPLNMRKPTGDDGA